jgi:predicted RNA-binding Zn ribbon-like protein
MAAHVAPGRLRLVQEFVNTLETDEDRDDIATPALLVAWLAERGLLDPVPPGGRGMGRGGIADGAADHARAIEVREALRRLLLANNAARPPAPADLELLNRAALESGLRPRFGAEGGVRLVPERGGVSGALGVLLAVVADAMAEGTWPRLKACAEDTCVWAFYDRSKNRSGHWCSMEVCGNRAKARSFRRRQRRTLPAASRG